MKRIPVCSIPLLLSLFSTAAVFAEAAAPRRPNILIIVADDLGYADSACYGSKDIPTPNIDSIARAGMRCTQGYVTADSCSPSRAGLLSGRYQERFGFEFNCNAEASRKNPTVVGLDPSATTIADVLKKDGYATGIVGKWHIGFDKTHHPQVRGFDDFFGFLSGAHVYLPPDSPGVRADTEKGAVNQIMRGHEPVKETSYLTEAFAREGCAFIDRNASHPFFLYLAFNAVHTPFETTDEYAKRFSSVTDPKRRVYYAMVSALDDAIGRVLATLKKDGLEDNTLVLFLSDNGGPMYTDVQSNGPLRLGKLYLFEGGVRVPIMFRWPGVIKPGSVYDGVLSSLDFFPTITSAAGATIPPNLALDGVNLLPYLKGEKKDSAHDILCWRNGPNRAIRKADWKLIQAGENVWLFDLTKDLGEKTNLADANPDKVRELKAALSEWEKGMKPPAWPSRPAPATDVDGKKYEIHI